MQLAAPVFPPLLTGRPVAAGADAFSLARQAAAQGLAGAGDAFWSEAVDRLDVAVVLEPEVGLTEAIQAHMALMVAFGDALGALSPPEVAVHYRWPSTILVNGAEVGRARLASPDALAGSAVPPWLVAGLEIAIKRPDLAEPGLDPSHTSLWEEGCGNLDRTRLVESVSRHFLAWIDTWQSEGVRPVVEAWLARAVDRGRDISLAHDGRQIEGRFLGLDEHGNLLVQSAAGAEALSLAAALLADGHD